MRRDSYLGNPRYTNLILTLDQQYVRSLSQSLFGDTKVDKAHFVHRSCYFKPEFSCCLCGAGNKRRGNRPAAFFPTEVGYIYTCLACNPSLNLLGEVSIAQILQRIFVKSTTSRLSVRSRKRTNWNTNASTG